MNLVVNDILKGYLLNSKTDLELNITAKVRHIAIITKYNKEPKTLLIEKINKYKKESILPPNYNKTTISLDNNTR